MNEKRYTYAGYAAIAAVIFNLITGFLGVITGIGHTPIFFLFPLIVTTSIIQTACSIYAVTGFRKFLNERYECHKLDTLIILLIIGTIIVLIVSLYIQSLGLSDLEDLPKSEVLPVLIPTLFLFAAVNIPLGIISIIYAIRLMQLPYDLFGYRMGMAWTHLIGSALIMTFLLAPLGLMVLVTSELLEGLILLKAGKQETELEFV